MPRLYTEQERTNFVKRLDFESDELHKLYSEMSDDDGVI